MRPSKEEYFLSIAALVSSRSTCLRKSVGCVLVNERGHILATGYNGVAMGAPHCNEQKLIKHEQPVYPNACPAARSASGSNLDGCEAIHAEQNALLQCKDVWDIHTCYTTNSPCVTCVKLLLNTSCKRIIFIHAYAHDEVSRELWHSSGPGKVWWYYGQADLFPEVRLPDNL